MGDRREKRHFTAHQKVEIVLAGIKSGNVAEVCRAHDISNALFYQWRDKLMEGGLVALAGKATSSPVSRYPISTPALTGIRGSLGDPQTVASGRRCSGRSTSTPGSSRHNSAPGLLLRDLAKGFGKRLWIGDWFTASTAAMVPHHPAE